MGEDVYEYVEKTHYGRYKQVEKIFNAFKKSLQNFLYKKYNVNINGKSVSRAWIKMYELYRKTKYFSNLGNNVRVFHICEAPGNFINASIYYVKHNTDIKNYDWNAQSLTEGGLGDQYGFMSSIMSV